MIQTLLVIAGVTGAVVTIGGFFVMFWRLFKRMGAITEGIMGRPPVLDLAGETVEKAVPSLQARVGKIEELLIGVADANERLLALETWRIEHEEFSQDLVRRLLDMHKATD